jgi:hypothetical protein
VSAASASRATSVPHPPCSRSPPQSSA